MSSEGILSSSVTGKTHGKDLLRHHRTIHGEKKFKCHLCSYRMARNDNLFLYQKVHTKSSSDQTPKIKPKNETKTQLSSKKIDLLKEIQQPSNLKCKIPHQYPVTDSKYPRQENIIDPVDYDQFLNDIQKHENHDQAFSEFSQRYGEPWCDDEQLEELYKTHMSQIKNQEIRSRHTRTTLSE